MKGGVIIIIIAWWRFTPSHSCSKIQSDELDSFLILNRFNARVKTYMWILSKHLCSDFFSLPKSFFPRVFSQEYEKSHLHIATITHLIPTQQSDGACQTGGNGGVGTEGERKGNDGLHGPFDHVSTSVQGWIRVCLSTRKPVVGVLELGSE